MRGILTAALAAALALAGCSSDANTSTAGSTSAASTPSAAAATTTSPPSTTITTVAPTNDDATIGEAQLVGNAVRFTVQAVKSKVTLSSGPPDSGGRWYGALVRACVVKMPPGLDLITLSWNFWSANTSDGSNFPASDYTMGDFPRPAYPFADEGGLKQGDCAKGWILFPVSAGARITEIRYANNEAETAVWRVP